MNLNLIPIVSDDGRVSIINLQAVESVHWRPQDEKTQLKIEFSASRWREFNGPIAATIWAAIKLAVQGLGDDQSTEIRTAS